MTYGNIHPQDAARERLAELAEHLAAGLLRLRLKETAGSSGLSAHCGDSLVDFSPDQSVHADPQQRGTAA